MFQREKERKDVVERRKAILEAIKKFEYENPLKDWGPSDIMGKLKISISYRRLLSHSKELEKRGLITRVARGRYYSKYALFWKKTIQEFLIYDIYETVPRLEGEKFNEFVSRCLSVHNEFIGKYEKKSKVPLIGWLYYRRKLDNLVASKQKTKARIQNWLRKDFDFIENATEITVLSSKKLPYLNTYKIRETLAEVLYYMLGHERNLAEAKEQKFSLEDFGLSIIVSFNPRKVGKPPSRPTMKELIAEIEKMPTEDREFLGFDEERLKHLKLLDKKQKELIGPE